MKKALLSIATLVCTLASLSSCLDDDNQKAEAEISYYATCDSITFFDENDTIYKDFIIEGLDSLKLAGSNSLFTTKAVIDYGYMTLAIAECNRLAIEKYGKQIQQYSLEDIKEVIFKKNQNTLDANNASEIPLDEFTATLSLRSTYTSNVDTIKTYRTIFW